LCLTCKRTFPKNPRPDPIIGPPCSCGSKRVHLIHSSTGERWHCLDCRKSQYVNLKPKKIIPAPSCKCGSSDTHSKGDSWVCYTCHKTWKKEYKLKIYAIKKGPVLCKCGSSHTGSAGNCQWRCHDCGISWMKYPIRYIPPTLEETIKPIIWR
jgi:hypothetical protein